MTVEVVHWNPLKPKPGPINKVLRRKEPVNNFGDLIGPVVVDHVVAESGLSPASGSGRLLRWVDLRMAKSG